MPKIRRSRLERVIRGLGLDKETAEHLRDVNEGNQEEAKTPRGRGAASPNLRRLEL